jgi:acetolactate synthase I/III small subunit
MPETLDMPLRPAPHPAGSASHTGPTSPRGGEVKSQTAPTSPHGGEVKTRIRVLSVLVEDAPHTLTKVSGAIRRRGFHVRGISVGPTSDPGRFRLTLEVDHGHAEADQVRKQLERLVEVIEVDDVTGDAIHSRELVVATVAASEVGALVRRGAKVLAAAPDGTTVEFSGDGEEVGEFVDELTRHGIVDVARSGPVVMRRTR